MMQLRALMSGHSSLSVRLLRVMVLPMAGLALLLGAGGALVIAHSVETVNDRILGAASRAIADTLTVEDGEIALNLSPAIFGMLEDNARDNVYYSVRHNGHVITGYADLPDIAPRGMNELQVVFANSRFRGHDIRVVAEGRRLPGIAEPLIVEVAETMDARERAGRDMLEGLALLELALIGLSAILLPVAVRWGLRPLVKLGDEMDRRVGSDLTPLPDTNVPSELLDLVRAFNGLLARLGTTLEGMRRFTADASHQMRTPLSILRTHIALLRSAEPGSEDARHSLDDIDQASARLQHLLVQLLTLARADNTDRADVKFEPTDLDALAESAASEHAPDAVRDHIDLQFVRSGGDATVRTQAGLAVELLGNLIDNAIRYNDQGGSVSVSVTALPDQVTIAIEDDGPGIPPEHREAAFTRFTRLNRRQDRAGSGLGLPIAQALAEAIGARIALHVPASGRGLRVEIAFPRIALTDS